MTALADTGSRALLAPETSIVAPVSTKMLPCAYLPPMPPTACSPALTATWPPVASTSEPGWKSTTPPVVISTRDRSWRSPSATWSFSSAPLCAASMRAASCAAELAMLVARCEFSAVAALVSSRIAVVLPGARVTPVPRSAPLPGLLRCAIGVSRWTVPRWVTEVVDRTTPPWVTLRPIRLMSPVLAVMMPALPTAPLLPTGLLLATAISVPRVVEIRLPVRPALDEVTL